jgi:hypothetical protein
VVDPRFIRLVQTADRTSPGVFFNYFCFGGYAGNKEKHNSVQGFRVQPSRRPNERPVKSKKKLTNIEHPYYTPIIYTFANFNRLHPNLKPNIAVFQISVIPILYMCASIGKNNDRLYSCR